MLIIILLILINHFVADFIMQDEKWALGKSKNLLDLTLHVTTYTLCWIPLSVFITGFNSPFFLIITFVAHFITDYVTSRIVSKKFENKHYGSAILNLGAFTVIGFDQLLHYFQLILTYYFLSQ